MHRDLAACCAILHGLLPAGVDPAHARPAVSGWNVAQHIEHITLVNDGLVERICADSLPDAGVLPTRFIAHVVMLTKHIPRGRGKAPEHTRPADTADPAIRARLQAHIAALASSADRITRSLPLPGRFNHPVFGGLNRRQWLRFMHIHTRHHAAIIADILKP